MSKPLHGDFDPGCYGDGTFGHQHTRERCASILDNVACANNITGRDERALLMAADKMRADMSDDASEELDACELLDTWAPGVNASWGWQDGDFGLWPDDSEV